MTGTLTELVHQSIARTREATVSILGITDPGLRAHLVECLSNDIHSSESMLATPLFEHTFGWEPGDCSLEQLAGSLLNEQTIKALSETDNPDYRFDRAMKPYKHQLTAWRALTDKTPKSAVVTTGTGSGKTECFMVPILNDLIREQAQAGKPLVGVRALFLYPLNALINSQRERLDAWTAQQGNHIRYCLYNGNTEQSESKIRKEQRLKPNEVMSRELMRREPAPILMTNATMLEYMLVRQDDEPIFSLSREAESLRWIVLDEAHTYLGSQAAEISLLLRRVVAAFGKRAEQIRFVATSATIAGEDANDALRRYLASLAGVPESQVVVVTGKRAIPVVEHTPPKDFLLYEQMLEVDAGQEVSPARYEALSNHRLTYLLRNQILNAGTPQSLEDLMGSVGDLLKGSTATAQQDELFKWIDLMTATRPAPDKEPFLKLRTHLFQRMLHGLWTCVDPSCSHKTEQLENWPFGYVYTKQRSHCDCGSPVYEFANCNECGTPHIVAEDAHGKLRQVAPYVDDEFSLQDDSVDSLDEQTSASIHRAIQPLIIAPRANPHYQPISLDLDTATLASISAPRQIEIHQSIDADARCCQCDVAGRAGGSFLRKAYLGAPFYVSNAVPTVLEFCPDPIGGENPATLPGRGRKLITFTDSRQGTARMAVRMQQEAERSRLRGLVFEVLRNAQMRSNAESTATEPSVSVDALKASIATLEAAQQFEMVGMLKKQLEAAQGSSGADSVSIAWSEMVTELAATNDMMYSILKYNRYTNPQLFPDQGSAKQLADLLLLREYARRPKNQNSTETLGLIEVGYRGIDKLTRLPEKWQATIAPLYSTGESKALTVDDWHDFLVVALDFFVRENTFLTMDRDVQHWMGARFSPKSLLPPDSDDSGTSQIAAWPSCKEQGRQHRLAKILAAGSGLDLSNSLHRDIIDRWLKAAWSELIRGAILQSTNDGYQLARQSLTFRFPRKGFVCPVTNRLFARTFRGMTPYLPNQFDPKEFHCAEVHLPNYVDFAPSGMQPNKVTEIRQLIEGSEAVNSLRSASLWTDISDRTVEGGYYYRTAEHSAQQASQRLERYEEDFKAGQINVLNCSTTMEMGVDIGGISAVVMNNVPPHPANYLQRAGRAGRRSESLAVSYTLCKADPHNARVFNDPKWPFTKRIPAPVVTLNAAPLIQRHVNAYLLAEFLRVNRGSHNDSTKLNTMWFYGGTDSRASRFTQWLDDTSFDENHDLIHILKGTALQARSIPDLCAVASSMIKRLDLNWKAEAEQIDGRLKSALDEPYKRALEHEKARHENEYLLKDLSARAFLPGHGFPTDLVTLNTSNNEDFSAKRSPNFDMGREDNIFTFKAEPSRGLAMALREYAPGSTIVVDGRVYKSAGVKLQDYQQPGSNNLKFDLAWRCSHCGTSGYAEYAYSADAELSCHECGSDIRLDEKRRVLRPIGFTTDFWESTTNNVTSQVFMPIVAPRVRVEGRQSPMPDPACGFVRYGEDGHIFYQSEGQHGHGYAVCLSCGRAESMTPNGHVPDSLRADRNHRPIGGLMGSSRTQSCSGASVMQNIHLGYETRTHVLEWIPRNPLNGAWLSGSSDDRVVATTLAVALRDEIAEQLGIESTEMGFAHRQERDTDTGEVRLVVQVYDQIAGGAGFVLSALNNLVLMISGAIERLECSSGCDSSCSNCLASKDSRVEFEHINRLTTLEWLKEAQYTDYLKLPPPLDTVADAKYFCHKPITELISGVHATTVSHVYLTLSGNQESWELGSHDVRKVLSELIWGRNIKVTLRSEHEVVDPLQKEQLMLLARLGVGLCVGGHSNLDLHPMLQAELDNGELLTLATGDVSHTHGIAWLTQNTQSPWIQTTSIAKVQSENIDATAWLSTNSTTLIEITSELNGPIKRFPDRFRELIKQNAPKWMKQLEGDPVVSMHYEDRYLKSPWAALLLAGVFWVFKNDALETIEVTTHFKDGFGQPKWLWDNWDSSDDYLTVMPKLFDAITGVSSHVDIKNVLNQVSHRRILTLTLKSGRTVKCSFDQGMGYWNAHAPNPKDRMFDFEGSVNDQLKGFLDVWASVTVTNSGTWPTHILLYEIENV